jgi:hypothetical protein
MELDKRKKYKMKDGFSLRRATTIPVDLLKPSLHSEAVLHFLTVNASIEAEILTFAHHRKCFSTVDDKWPIVNKLQPIEEVLHPSSIWTVLHDPTRWAAAETIKFKYYERQWGPYLYRVFEDESTGTVLLAHSGTLGYKDEKRRVIYQDIGCQDDSPSRLDPCTMVLVEQSGGRVIVEVYRVEHDGTLVP